MREFRRVQSWARRYERLLRRNQTERGDGTMRSFLQEKWVELLVLAAIGIAWTMTAVWAL